MPLTSQSSRRSRDELSRTITSQRSPRSTPRLDMRGIRQWLCGAKVSELKLAVDADRGRRGRLSALPANGTRVLSIVQYSADSRALSRRAAYVTETATSFSDIYSTVAPLLFWASPRSLSMTLLAAAPCPVSRALRSACIHSSATRRHCSQPSQPLHTCLFTLLSFTLPWHGWTEAAAAPAPAPVPAPVTGFPCAIWSTGA